MVAAVSKSAASTVDFHRERPAPSRARVYAGLPTSVAQWPAESQRRWPSPMLWRPHPPTSAPRMGRCRSADRRYPRNVCPGHKWGPDQACFPQRRLIVQTMDGATLNRTLGTSWPRRSGNGSPTWAWRGCLAAAGPWTARPPTRGLPAPSRPPASMRWCQHPDKAHVLAMFGRLRTSSLEVPAPGGPMHRRRCHARTEPRTPVPPAQWPAPRLWAGAAPRQAPYCPHAPGRNRQ